MIEPENTPTQPTELDKAIERLLATCGASESDGDQYSRDVTTVAKRLKEVEKERNELKILLVAIRNSIPTNL